MKKEILFLLCVLFTSSIFGQRILTLDESIAIAMKESYNIKSAKYSLESSQKSLEAIKRGLLSSIDLEFDLPSYDSRLFSQFNSSTEQDEFFKRTTTNIEGRIYVRQPILFSNGMISLIGLIKGREQVTSTNLRSRDYFSNFIVSLNQPLFDFNNQKASLERAEINKEKSKRNYTKAEYDIVYNVTAAFYQLYSSKKNVEITKDRVKQNELSYNTALNKFRAGLIAEDEALKLEVDLATSKNELLDAERTFENSKNNFKFLIGLDLDEDIDIVAKLDYKPINIDAQTAISNALEKRTDLLNYADDKRLRELTIDETDAKHRIKANITAKYGINKNAQLFENIFRNYEDNRSVKMTISVPILDWGKNRREVEAAKANLKLAEERFINSKKSIRNEIVSAINKLNSAKSRVEVLSKSVKVAEKGYQISIERFKAGKITSFELSQVQLSLTNAKLSSLNALIDYKLAIADLEKKTLTKYDYN